MKILHLICLTMIFVGIMPATNSAANIKFQTRRGMERCTVVDPTGTLLNVRSSPNGKKIVSRLKNGTSVFIEDYSSDAEDREWALVRLTGKKVNKPLGWVLKDFLECE